MSLFNNIFGNSEPKDTPKSALDWNALTELKQLDSIISESAEKPVLIFKHSTRCSISRMALKNFEQEYKVPPSDASLYFLDLLEHRDISNEIAERFQVMHQSPQLLLIKNGASVYNSSHSDIDAETVTQKINP